MVLNLCLAETELSRKQEGCWKTSNLCSDVKNLRFQNFNWSSLPGSCARHITTTGTSSQSEPDHGSPRISDSFAFDFLLDGVSCPPAYCAPRPNVGRLLSKISWNCWNSHLSPRSPPRETVTVKKFLGSMNKQSCYSLLSSEISMSAAEMARVLQTNYEII